MTYDITRYIILIQKLYCSMISFVLYKLWSLTTLHILSFIKTIFVFLTFLSSKEK